MCPDEDLPSAGERKQPPDSEHVPTQSLADATTPLSELDAADLLPAARPTTSYFASGQLLSDRYRIVRLLGQGGMGEVYEADDLELKERVALKTILPHIASDQEAIQRFRREVQLARKVTHPNVCRIFDVFHHSLPPTESGKAARVTFVTMELLEGETLAAYLRRHGRLTPQEAAPIVTQIASGLEAAHAAGIIHRDFKSANVMLVRKASGKDFRAVVTDFGLARLAGADLEAAAVTGTGVVLGTPAYMAPEQVEGKTITAAADIYALGVVMYEMITGRWPFIADNPLSIALKRLRETPRSPRAIVADLEPAWDEAILRCLERNPGDRFSNATDVARAISGDVTLPSPRRARERAKLLAVLAISFVLLAVLVLAGYQLLRSRDTGQGKPELPRPIPVVHMRRSVAVLGFKNLTGQQDVAWLSTALSEMLTSELSRGGKLRAIPGEDVGRAKRELSLTDTDTLSRDTISRLHANLGSDFVVLGSYLAAGAAPARQIRLDVRVQDAATGQVTTEIVNGTEDEMLDLMARAGSVLRSALGISEVSGQPASYAALPANAEAARLYALGLSKLRLSDALAARDLLERAVAADPKYPLAHSALAAAWAAMGYDGKARAEAKTAFDLSQGLSREERLSVEARYREAMNEWNRAVEINRTLFDFYPDNLDYGLRLASAQLLANKPRDASTTIAALRRLAPPSGTDPRIDLAAADAAESVSDFKAAAAAAAKAAQAGSERGARLIVARARTREGNSLRRLGETPRALDAFAAAKKIYESAGDRGGVATVLNAIASTRMEHGELDAARQGYEDALAIHTAIGDERSASATLNNLANVATQQGDIARAKAMYERSLAIDERTDDKRGQAQVLSHLGYLLFAEGNVANAKKNFLRSVEIGRGIGDRLSVANALGNLGNLLYYAEGDTAGARKNFEESLGIARAIGDKTLTLRTLNDLATVLSEQGEIAAAKKHYQESLDLAKQLGDKVGEATAESNLALTLFQLGDLAAASPGFERALGLWSAIGDRSLSAYTLSDYADLLLAAGDVAGCSRRLQEALKIREALGEKSSALENRLSLAAVSIETGQAAVAEPIAREAAKQFAAEQNADSEARAHAILASSLLAQKKTKDASAAAARALELAKNSQRTSVRLQVTVAAARVSALAGNTAAAATLQTAAADAKRGGFVPNELEARFALLEIRPSREAAVALANEARAKGFGLVERKAAAIR